jgi:hypothetical protein
MVAAEPENESRDDAAQRAGKPHFAIQLTAYSDRSSMPVAIAGEGPQVSLTECCPKVEALIPAWYLFGGKSPRYDKKLLIRHPIHVVRKSHALEG